MGLFTERKSLRPYEYERYHLAHEAVMASPWSPHEVQMGSDLADWGEVSDKERNAITKILRGFTLAEEGVGCYWGNNIASFFKAPEVVNMARAFSYQETVHAKAYDFLEATLGINSCDGFIKDPISTKKIEDIFIYLNEDFCTQLAIFSGAVEGVSLFSSFAILLSFLKENRFKGIAQILSWSTLDENLHSKFGIDLFKTYCKEESSYFNSNAIYEAFRLIVENEIFVLNQIFSEGDLPSISKKEAVSFLYYRANMKLIELGLSPFFPHWVEYKSVKSLFDLQVFGKTQNDFFALSRNGGSYSSMSSRDYSSLSLKEGKYKYSSLSDYDI